MQQSGVALSMDTVDHLPAPAPLPATDYHFPQILQGGLLAFRSLCTWCLPALQSAWADREIKEKFLFLSVLLGVSNEAHGSIATGHYLETTKGTALE